VILLDLIYYQFPTPSGAVSIVPAPNGRWKLVYKGDDLGSYHSAAAAASDASVGSHFGTSDGTNLGTLGIPEELADWHKLPFAKTTWE